MEAKGTLVRRSSFRRKSSSSLTRHHHNSSATISSSSSTGRPARHKTASALHAATANGHLESVKLLLASNSTTTTAVDTLDAQGVTPLYVAACNGFLEIVRLLLDRGANVDFRDADGETPLYVATSNGFLEIVVILLDVGRADVNLGDADGVTPLYIACEHGHLKIVRMLLDRGTNAEIADSDGDTPLHVAAQNGHLEVVELLLTRREVDVNVDQGNAAGVTALIVAAQNGFADIARVLIVQGGGDVNRADSEGISPLCMAAHNGHISVVHELLNQGANVDLKSNGGESALYFAAQNGHVDVVQLLTERGAEVDAADSVGVTALSIAAQNGHCRVVECLLDHGARADLVDCDGDTALIAASQYGHTDVVQLLLRRGGAAVDFPDVDGATPLYLAAQNGHARVVTLLLQAGAEPDFAEGDGATPLYAAAYNGHAEVVENLLSHGAKADFVAEIGVTPLYAAAFNGYSEIAKILLARGVQVDFKTAVGVTPLYVASQNGFPDAVAVLVEGGANVNLAVPSGATPLYIAAQNGHLQVVDMLIKGGAIPDLADADGATPLYISSQNGHADVVKLLLSRDVNIDCATPNGGVTPLYIAAQNGYIDVVRILLALGANVNRAATNGATPLYVVAQSGHLDIVTLLLDEGASVNLAASNGTTLLHVASQHGHVDIVTQLIQHGADIDRTDNDGDTPLMAAAQHGHVHIARVLLDSAARVDLRNTDGISPLYISAQNRHQDMLALLLRYGANVNQCAADGTTPLYAAAFHGYSKVMTLLLDENADADLSQGLSATPLYAAAYNGYIDAVRILLDRGAALGNAMADGTTPLYVAAQNGHYNVVKLLLDRGASLEFAAEECPGPIFSASQNGHLSVVQLLVRRGANVNIAGPNGTFPLLVASKFGHLDVIKLLVQAGAVVDAVDFDGDTPLISASRSGHIEIVQELLQNGAALNIANDAGETPVLAAGSMRKFDVVKLLVGAGASVHVKAKNGETLLLSAARWSDLAFVAWLIELGYLNFESSKGPGVEASLISATLQALGEYEGDLFEFQVMWRDAVERLKSIYLHFEDDQATETSLVQQFVAMIFRLLRLHQLCKKTNSFTRIAISADVVASIHDFHAEMDHLVRRVKSEVSSLDGWSTEIHIEPDFFSSEMLPSDEELYSVVSDEADQIEAVSLLHHVVSAHSDKHSDRTLDLIELCLDKLSSLSNVHVPPIPSWFVPRHEVVIDASGLIQLNDVKNVYTGKWMNSSVVIVEYSETHDNFNEDAERWFQLSHPNVISLFGAFHLSLPHVVIFENTSHLHLREYLVNPEKSSSVWQRMLEVALGLKYLHERGIVLGKLMCDNIWVGTGGAAKICGFGLKFYSKTSTEGLDSARWTSPEVLRGEQASSASDVYSLGMCIIEAVTGLAPWGDEPCEQVRSLVKWGFRPCCPATMSIAQWRLIQCMCVYDPEKRLKIVSVIEHLRYFATQEREESPERRATRTSEGSKIAELGASVDEFLARLRSKCLLCQSARDSVLYVHARLVDIHHHLQEMHKLPTDVAMTKLCEVLLNVDTFLRVAVSEASVTQRAKSQKVALKAHVHHKEIDELVDLLNIRKPGSIHDWEVKEAQLMMSNSLRRNCSDEVQALAFGLKDGQTGPGVKILRFESKHLNEKFNPTKFTLVDRRIREQAEPPWFIPMHELKFQQDGYIAAGSFGAIYHGSWLGTSVVVKLMGYEDEANGLDFFLHELRVWYPLSHPHVIKLYGACHVGKRFFVCEYASNGTLREYLQISGRHRVLWQKLHELALGLQYLHELNIVHNDLKCDNCLIASDGKAKLADFGLSCIPNSAEIRIDIKMQGAQHWKSPEHLQGERPTKASDIYSLGMCVLEAVTGEAPWGGAVDVMVRFHVKRGRLPPRPVSMTDDQWDLIEMMCASDPKNRIKIQSVVERLEEFTKQDAKRKTLEPDPEPRS